MRDKAPAVQINLEKYIESALLEEVFTTPKPGLVDSHDSGAHCDMNVDTFVQSARTIAPYLQRMFYEGYCWKSKVEELFPVLQKTGMQAEKAMFRATKGINTHKGSIFTIGILCGAAGLCYKQRGRFRAEEILKMAELMVRNSMEAEFQKMKMRKPVTHGEWLYHMYGEKGIRGEAQNGFPIIKEVAYPTLKALRKREKNRMCININVLLQIMTTLNDTNILSRGSYKDLKWIKETSIAILKLGGAFTEEGFRAIVKMNERCIEKNISPGGAADILAATIFLYKLEDKMG